VKVPAGGQRKFPLVASEKPEPVRGLVQDRVEAHSMVLDVRHSGDKYWSISWLRRLEDANPTFKSAEAEEPRLRSGNRTSRTQSTIRVRLRHVLKQAPIGTTARTGLAPPSTKTTQLTIRP